MTARGVTVKCFGGSGHGTESVNEAVVQNQRSE